MSIILELKDKIIKGEHITKSDALRLIDAPFNELTKEANNIREYFCKNKFDACTILNVKNGRCSENCSFCAQSIHHNTNIKAYPMMSEEELIKSSKKIIKEGFKRISYVASGRNISDNEFNTIINSMKELKKYEDDINICVSLGLLSDKQISTLEKYNVDRIHNNLETSKNYFKHICTTHDYEEKIERLKHINKENITICSGGIFGIGESFEDRLDLAIELRNLKVKSIPINVLNPIEKTPVENYPILSNEELCRIIAIFRFINPQSFIRLAGGRILLEDNGKKAFMSGANACILGNMLTTKGVSIEDDLKMIKKMGYEITYH